MHARTVPITFNGFWMPMDTSREYNLLNEMWDNNETTEPQRWTPVACSNFTYRSNEFVDYYLICPPTQDVRWLFNDSTNILFNKTKK